jgi:hypothetical protein
MKVGAGRTVSYKKNATARNIALQSIIQFAKDGIDLMTRVTFDETFREKNITESTNFTAVAAQVSGYSRPYANATILLRRSITCAMCAIFKMIVSEMNVVTMNV